MEWWIVALAVATAALVVVEPGGMLLALCVPLAVLAFLHSDFFLCAMVFLLPWYPFIDWKLPLRDVFLIGRFVLFAGVFLIQAKRGVSLKAWLWKGWARKGMLMFVLVSVFSLVISDSRATIGPYKAAAKLLSYAAVFFSIAGWANSKERIEAIVKLILGSTIVVALFGFYQAFDGGFTSLYFRLYPGEEEVFSAAGGWSGRITSFLFHFNSLAGYLNAVIPFAVGVAVLARARRLRWFGFACLATSVAALYLTSSRGGLVAFGVIALLSMLCLTPRRTTAVVLLAAILAGAVIVLPLTPKESVQAERLQTLDDFTRDSRVALWGAAILIFADHPLLGAGFGTYRFSFHRFVPGITDDLDAHNLYLQTLAEVGIAGFLIFFVTLGAFVRISVRLAHNSDVVWRIVGMGVGGVIAGTLVHGLVDYIFIASPQFGNLFWLVLGLGLAAVELSEHRDGTASTVATAEAR